MTDDVISTVRRIHAIFKKESLRLASIESCTGGLISHWITALPGASHFFMGGLVAYSVDVKKAVLGIPEKIINQHGVVSEETAMEMARKGRELLNADYAISTTGNLGPESLEGKDVGLVFFGLSSPEGSTVRSNIFRGDRESNKHNAALYALKFLLEYLNG